MKNIIFNIKLWIWRKQKRLLKVGVGSEWLWAVITKGKFSERDIEVKLLNDSYLIKTLKWGNKINVSRKTKKTPKGIMNYYSYDMEDKND